MALRVELKFAVEKLDNKRAGIPSRLYDKAERLLDRREMGTTESTFSRSSGASLLG